MVWALTPGFGGKNRTTSVSAAVGTPPEDQLPGLLQLPFTAPLQVCEPATAVESWALRVESRVSAAKAARRLNIVFIG